MSEQPANGAPPDGSQGAGPYRGPRAHEPEPVHDHSDDPTYVTRTKFLTNVAVVGGVAMTAAIAVPVVGFAIAQPLQPEEFRWVDIGPASDYLKNPPPYPNPTPSQKFGEVTSLAVAGPAPEADRRVFIRYGPKSGVTVPTPSSEESTAEFEVRFREFARQLTPEDFDLIAIWNRCAHLGCPAAFSPGSQGYSCPCHGGAYDSRGLVTAGPPPRPLDRLDTKIVDRSRQYTVAEIEAGKDVIPVAVAASRPNPNYAVLVGKPFSIDQDEQPFPLAVPGYPVTGTLSHLYPFE